MKRSFIVILAVLAAFAVSCVSNTPQIVSQADRVGKSFIERFPDPDTIHMAGQRNHFTWQAGYMMYAMEKMWLMTGDSTYYNYIKRYVDQQVDAEGNVPDFSPRALDNFSPGYAILFMYEQTGEERYRKAAETIRRGFDEYPRTDLGLFWHSHSFRSQAWVDGVYMGQIFLARYGKTIGDSEYAFSEAVKQITLIAQKCQKENGLLLHAWDESKKARWANPETGLAPEVWSEGMGWYSILMADIFDYLPADMEGLDYLMESTIKMCEGLKATQDPETGMWCQVVDKCGWDGNWNETSGTGMFMYLLQRAIDKGYISKDEYQPVVDKAYEGIQTKLATNEAGFIDIIDCSSIGVKTSYEDYISQPKDVSQFTVFSSFMLGAGVVEFGTENL